MSVNKLHLNSYPCLIFVAKHKKMIYESIYCLNFVILNLEIGSLLKNVTQLNTRFSFNPTSPI